MGGAEEAQGRISSLDVAAAKRSKFFRGGLAEVWLKKSGVLSPMQVVASLTLCSRWLHLATKNFPQKSHIKKHLDDDKIAATTTIITTTILHL
jgi:hypothetical protein